MSRLVRALCAVVAAAFTGPSPAFAQSPTQLPRIVVESQKPKPGRPRAAQPTQPVPQAPTTPTETSVSLTVPNTERARIEIERTPGAVAVVPETAFKTAPALTIMEHPSGFSVGPNIEWVPQAYYVDSANTLTTEAYLLWGLKAAYDDGRHWSAYLEGRNLSDKAYIASASIIDRANAASRLFNPGTGRGIFGGIRYRL